MTVRAVFSAASKSSTRSSSSSSAPSEGMPFFNVTLPLFVLLLRRVGGPGGQPARGTICRRSADESYPRRRWGSLPLHTFFAVLPMLLVSPRSRRRVVINTSGNIVLVSSFGGSG